MEGSTRPLAQPGDEDKDAELFNWLMNISVLLFSTPIKIEDRDTSRWRTSARTIELDRGITDPERTHAMLHEMGHVYLDRKILSFKKRGSYFDIVEECNKNIEDMMALERRLGDTGKKALGVLAKAETYQKLNFAT
jgi:hypothetical protein